MHGDLANAILCYWEKEQGALDDWGILQQEVPHGHGRLDEAPRLAFEVTAHLAALELHIDQQGSVGDTQYAGPPAPCRGLQLQGEAVLQPVLPAQLLAVSSNLFTELAHLSAEVVHFRVPQGIKLMETFGDAEEEVSTRRPRGVSLSNPYPQQVYLCQ